jgi:hypothetical protein
MYGNTCGDLLESELTTHARGVVGAKTAVDHAKSKGMDASILVDASSRNFARIAGVEAGHGGLLTLLGISRRVG